MSAASTLQMVIGALDDAPIPYMLVGSFASTIHGAPRTTHDIDLVVDPTHEALTRFIAMVESPTVYAGPDPHDALERRDQFNIIDTDSGWKIDLMIRKNRAFSRSEFARRIKLDLLGVPVWVATAEDTVLAKLEWAAMSGSDRQLADAAAVLDVNSGSIDEGYLAHWAGVLGLGRMLERIKPGS